MDANTRLLKETRQVDMRNAWPISRTFMSRRAGCTAKIITTTCIALSYTWADELDSHGILAQLSTKTRGLCTALHQYRQFFSPPPWRTLINSVYDPPLNAPETDTQVYRMRMVLTSKPCLYMKGPRLAALLRIHQEKTFRARGHLRKA